jgi:hypothetical protein
MRLSSLGFRLGLAAVLLFSSTLFAQHHEASAPSSPPPSAAPSPAPAPSPTPAPTAAPSAPASVNFSHGSEVSAPVSARAPESHIESGGSAGSRVPSPTFSQSSSGAAAPTSGAERVIPANRITSDEKLAPATRIGETSPEKGHVAKPTEPDLRRRICTGSDCKEPVLKAGPPQSDLRHRICPGGVCHCPPGQTASKGGCVTNSTDNQSAYQNQYQTQCAAGQWWNGTSCTSPGIGCGGITSRAEMLLNELRSLAVQVQDACTNDPTSAECNDAKMRREGALQRYRMLQNEATPDCRAQLLEPPL